MKYNTRPINFDGCHPVIAEHLKRGEIVKCKVWDFSRDKGREVEEWICRYNGNSELPYISGSDTPWKHAEPIPLKVKRIMPPERAIQALIAEGFAFTSKGDLSGPEITLTTQMYVFMGKYLDGEASGFTWPSCIIEEVEDDE